MRALITGVCGFVGRHLTAELVNCGSTVDGIDFSSAKPPDGIANLIAADVTDTEAVADIVERHSPEVVFHLAGAASVGASFADPLRTWEINLGGTLAICEAIRTRSPTTRLVCVTSAEVYGHVDPDALPVTEDTPLNPHSPYAASKAAADIAVHQYHRGYGLDAITVRPFNHIGPGQSDAFVVPAIARQIAEGERAQADVIDLRIGNTDSRRDFMDVRDVVRAYRLIAERGHAGEAYVIGRGASVAVQDLLDTLISFSSRPVNVVSDPMRRRVGEPVELYGTSEKLRRHTGWTPTIDLQTTLRETLADWRTNSK